MHIFRRIFGSQPQPSKLDDEVASAAREVGKFRDDYMTPSPGLAKEMLLKLSADYAASLAIARRLPESIAWRQFSYALAGKDQFQQLAEMDQDQQIMQALAILASGDFANARHVFEFLSEKYPDNFDIATSLSALYLRAGNTGRANEILCTYFSQYPFTSEATGDDAQDATTLLVIAGNDKTRYAIGGSEPGSYYVYRNGGHFMLTYLLDSTRYHTVNFTISEGNIGRISECPKFDLILNTLADADREYTSLKSLEAYLETHPSDTPIINHPTQVLATTRDGNYARLNQLAGFVFPRTERLPADPENAHRLADDIEGRNFTYPMIVRETGTHTAFTTALVKNRDELENYLQQVKGDSIYVIQFIENATAEGHYSKLRFFSIDKKLYPVVHHTDEVWNVHGSNRKTFMLTHPWMLERERQFLADPASVIGQDIYDRLHTLPDIIGLDFFGFDFTILEDRSVLIFELNPAMRHSFVHGQTFPYMMPYLQNITDAFERMVQERATISG